MDGIDTARTRENLSNDPMIRSHARQDATNGVDVFGFDDEREPDSHIEHAKHLFKFDAAQLLKPRERRRN